MASPMNDRISLQAASLILLAIASVFAALVAERVVAALWQWYKFYGYSVGYATLSARTAFYFLLCAAGLLAAAFLIRLQALRFGITFAARSASASSNILGLSVFVYLALAFSPLNVWRP